MAAISFLGLSAGDLPCSSGWNALSGPASALADRDVHRYLCSRGPERSPILTAGVFRALPEVFNSETRVFPGLQQEQPVPGQHSFFVLWKTASPLDHGAAGALIGRRRPCRAAEALAWLRSSRGSDGTAAPEAALTGWSLPCGDGGDITKDAA